MNQFIIEPKFVIKANNEQQAAQIWNEAQGRAEKSQHPGNIVRLPDNPAGFGPAFNPPKPWK